MDHFFSSLSILVKVKNAGNHFRFKSIYIKHEQWHNFNDTDPILGGGKIPSTLMHEK
jgi:hypothetical protein